MPCRSSRQMKKERAARWPRRSVWPGRRILASCCSCRTSCRASRRRPTRAKRPRSPTGIGQWPRPLASTRSSACAYVAASTTCSGGCSPGIRASSSADGGDGGGRRSISGLRGVCSSGVTMSSSRASTRRASGAAILLCTVMLVPSASGQSRTAVEYGAAPSSTPACSRTPTILPVISFAAAARRREWTSSTSTCSRSISVSRDPHRRDGCSN